MSIYATDPMNWEAFRRANWDLMNDVEQAAWLHKFVLLQDVRVRSGSFFLNDSEVRFPTSDELASAEHIMGTGALRLYVENATTLIASKPKRNPFNDPTLDFYYNVLTMTLEDRCRCLYWAALGERV